MFLYPLNKRLFNVGSSHFNKTFEIMSNKIRYCLLCERYDGRTKHIGYTRIYTVEREEKLREGYRRRYNGQEINQPLLNQIVHKKCYNKTIQYIPSVDESIPSNDVSISNEQNHDEEQDQVKK
jgi:hypothetical protein